MLINRLIYLQKTVKVALISSKKLCEVTWVLKGLFNAAATFQWAMDNILGDLKMASKLVYLDDITVFPHALGTLGSSPSDL